MPNKKTFETALNVLEAIIQELESGSPTLDEMMKLFEDGMKLMTECQEHLLEAEGRITTLIKTQDEFSEKRNALFAKYGEDRKKTKPAITPNME